MDLPRYKHFECSGCVYLGMHGYQGLVLDLYRCGTSVVIRWGHHPDELGHVSDNFMGLPIESLDLICAQQGPDPIEMMLTEVRARHRLARNS